jgi:hypothetical protein
MKSMRKADIALIVVLLLAAPVFLFINRHFSAQKGVYAEIYHDSTLVYRIKLSTAKEGSFSIPGVPKVVFHQYADGSIAFIQSDCPDKICIRSGRLKNAGQFAACLPNKVMLKIVSEEKDRKTPDMIIE